MDTHEMRLIAEAALVRHGLSDWTFGFDRGTNRFGLCRYTEKRITMSRRLVELNDVERCKSTLMHEVAHALVGYAHGHDAVWQAKAIELGSDGRARFSESNTKMTYKYKARCGVCGTEHKRQKMTARANRESCGVCYRRTGKLVKVVWKPAAEVNAEPKLKVCPVCFVELPKSNVCSYC